MAEIVRAEDAQPDYCRGYSADVDTIREQEYPMMNGISSTSYQIIPILI